MNDSLENRQVQLCHDIENKKTFIVYKLSDSYNKN